MIFILKHLGLYGFRFLGISGFLGFLFFVCICCHYQFGAKASAAAVTTNVTFLLVLSSVFSPALLSFFPNYLFPLPSTFLFSFLIS
jgi:hypothetical protein